MNIFKKYTKFLFVFIIIISFGFSIYKYNVYVKDQLLIRQNIAYKQAAHMLDKTLEHMIESKQNATSILSITLSKNRTITDAFKTKKIPFKMLHNLLSELKKNTIYKNLWLQFIDKSGVSFYRSWTNKSGDNLLHARSALSNLLAHPKALNLISVGKFDLSIKSMVPIFDKKSGFLGFSEVISHFNSISKQLEKSGVKSIVLADKRFKPQLIHPVTRRFIDGYYIANQMAEKKLISYLHKKGIKNYLQDDSFKVENGFLIVSTAIKDINGKNIGIYIMFKPLKDISAVGFNFLSFKIMAIGIGIISIFLILMGSFFYYIDRKQKNYFKKIIDSASSIILISDGKKMMEANRIFFKYFNKEHSLKDFLKRYSCICNLFEKEEGCLQPEIDGKTWIDILIEHPDKEYKAKINYNGNIWYFMLRASEISKNSEILYTIIMVDITKMERYRQKLEVMATTDPLTGIKNRRYFKEHLSKEVDRTHRYGIPFSMIMFDIDHFKRVNDKYGHDVGDNVLIESCKIVKNIIRESDIFCRVGGEEFMIILPSTGLDAAAHLAERIRLAIANHPMKKAGFITISLGVVECSQKMDKEECFKRSDNALYMAKEKGRNQVVKTALR